MREWETERENKDKKEKGLGIRRVGLAGWGCHPPNIRPTKATTQEIKPSYCPTNPPNTLVEITQIPLDRFDPVRSQVALGKTSGEVL